MLLYGWICNMEEKPDTKSQEFYDFYDPFLWNVWIGKSMQKESGLVLVKGGARAKPWEAANRYGGNGNVLKVDRGADFTTFWIDHSPLDCVLSNDKFYVMWILFDENMQKRKRPSE